MQFILGAATVFSLIGAMGGVLAGVLIRELPKMARGWSLRLLVALSIFPTFGHFAYLRRSYIDQVGATPELDTFVQASLLLFAGAILAGWVLGWFFPPLAAVTPPIAFVAYWEMPRVDLYLQTVPYFTIDNIPAVWTWVWEAGATVFLFSTGLAWWWWPWKRKTAQQRAQTSSEQPPAG